MNEWHNNPHTGKKLLPLSSTSGLWHTILLPLAIALTQKPVKSPSVVLTFRQSLTRFHHAVVLQRQHCGATAKLSHPYCVANWLEALSSVFMCLAFAVTYAWLCQWRHTTLASEMCSQQLHAGRAANKSKVALAITHTHISYQEYFDIYYVFVFAFVSVFLWVNGEIILKCSSFCSLFKYKKGIIGWVLVCFLVRCTNT